MRTSVDTTKSICLVLTQKVLSQKYVKEFNIRLNLGNGDQSPHFINLETEEQES